MITITIPGKPLAQGRGKAARWQAKDGRSGISVRDPNKSRDWKAAARAIAVDTLEKLGKTWPLYPDGPVRLVLYAQWELPKSQHRKRQPVVFREYHEKENGDIDNLLKITMDAMTGVLWSRDGQVAVSGQSKWIGKQGEPAYVEIKVGRPWDP